MAGRWVPQQIDRRLARWQQLAIRIPLGLIFVAHGGQNLFGWWGGAGFVNSLHSYQVELGLPQALAAAALLVPFFGGLLLLAGLLTRATALALAVMMVVAIVKVHWVNGFFMNWSLTPGRGHGIELDIALLGMCVMLVLGGPGAWAVDRSGA